MKAAVYLISLLLAQLVSAADFEAGVARVKITPVGPIWLSGFMGRESPSVGIHDDLWAKALALRDENRRLTVIITADLVAIPGTMANRIAAALERRFHVPRARVLINVSHTHTGPVVWGALPTQFELAPDQQERVRQYAARLEPNLITVAANAVAGLQPARLSFGRGSVGFAANRRVVSATGVKFGVNRSGPSDHDVPVLRIAGADGKVRAVLFGYACHNTTAGADLHISGDWAGMAQAAIEKAHPGSTALFLMLCGGDQGPYPKGSFDASARHGDELAREVDRVLSAKLDSVVGPVAAAFETIRLDLAPHSRETFEADLKHKDAAIRARAKAMLRAYDAGKPIKDIVYPLQVLRFGNSLAIVALGGEVVADYSLRLKREFPNERLIVAGYSNDVMCYIPSERVLKEGGYEAVTNMKHYGLPGPFAPGLEERIAAGVRDLLEQTRRAPVR